MHGWEYKPFLLLVTYSCVLNFRSVHASNDESYFKTVSSVRATIDVISGREGTFRVKCTSFGGKTFTMTVEGPQYSSDEQGQMMVEAVGEPQRMGNDTYSATTSVISEGYNGDIYQCTASNGVAPNQTHSVELKSMHFYNRV